MILDWSDEVKFGKRQFDGNYLLLVVFLYFNSLREAEGKVRDGGGRKDTEAIFQKCMVVLIILSHGMLGNLCHHVVY